MRGQRKYLHKTGNLRIYCGSRAIGAPLKGDDESETLV